MRVLLNWLPSLGHKTGIGRYIADLLHAVRSQLAPGDSVDGFPDGWLGTIAGWGRRANRGGGGGGTPSSWKGWLRQRVVSGVRTVLESQFQATMRRGRYDLYHEPNNVPMAYDGPTITTLHDLSVLLYPQWHPVSRVAHYEKSFRDGLGRCDHLLTDTAAVKREIVRHLGVAPEKITPTLLGVNPEMRPVPAQQVASRLRALKLPERYLLCVGTIEPRKNQLMLLRAYVALPVAIRERFPLLLVGGLGWHTDEMESFLHEEGRSRGVIHLGYLPDGDLPALYTGARALLFPSFYEGFGLPPLEMQACGGAVIASTADALREILAGSPAALLDPNDADGWHHAMHRVCSDDDWWQTLRMGALAAAGRFTWERCASQTLAVYRQVLGQRSPLRLTA